MFFDPRDRLLVTGPSQRPPVLPELPPDGAIAEMVARFGADFDRVRRVERSNSRDLMLADALQPYLDAYERETGKQLANPYETAPWHDAQSHLEGNVPNSPALAGWRSDRLAEIAQLYEGARAQPGDRAASRLPQWPGEEGLRQQAIQRARTAEERAQIASALTFTGPGSIAGFAGSMASTMADPINLASLFAGAPGAAGIVRTMATEAAVGAGAEALLQPQVVAWKREIGQDPTFADAAANVALAGAGAGVFAGLFKGAGKAGAAGWRKVKPLLTREQRDAVQVADALDTIDRRNPFQVARQARLRGEQTGEAPTARFGEEMHAGDGGDHILDLEGLPREPESRILSEPTIERTAAGDQIVFPGAERVSQRQVLERRMAASDVRGGQAGLEGLGLFDEGARARQADLLDTPAGQSAVHVRATQEAETSLERGEVPDGPAIRAVDQAVPDIELPVWEARIGNGKTIRFRGPMDIVTWARTIGGLKDDAGELKARDLGKLNRGRPGMGESFLGRLVNNERGVRLDDAALAAWEAGYFPGHTSRPSPDDLLAAIDRTVAAGNDVDRRVWSEHDDDLVARMRDANRVDPDAEEAARDLLGDDVVDDALDALDGMPLIDEPLDPELQRLLEAGARAVAPVDDEAERITLAALQDELAAGDFRVTEDVIDEQGNVVGVSRSAREAWKDTQEQAAGWRDAAACMTGSAA